MRDEAHEPPDGGSSFGTLISRLTEDTIHLLDQKLDLFKLEILEEVLSAARRAALIAVGGAVAWMGVLFLFVATAIWLGELLGSRPGGFALAGGLWLLVGSLLIAMLMNQKAQRFALKGTVKELRRDAQWIKHEL